MCNTTIAKEKISKMKRAINKQIYSMNSVGVKFDSLDEDLFVYIYGKCKGRCEFPLIKDKDEYFINENVDDVYKTLNCLATECGIHLDYNKVRNKLV